MSTSRYCKVDAPVAVPARCDHLYLSSSVASVTCYSCHHPVPVSSCTSRHPQPAPVSVVMGSDSVPVRRWLQECKTTWPAVFLYSPVLRLSRQTLQHHFTQFGLVLKIIHGSCGKCCLVFFASKAAARQVRGVTQLVGASQLCPQRVDKATSRRFWRIIDGSYICDCCTPFTERYREDGLVIDEDAEGEGMKEVNQVASKTPAPTDGLTEGVMLRMVQRERRSLLLLRHLKKQAARNVFVKEKKSFESLQSLKRADSRVLVLGGKEEASLRLLRHLKGQKARQGNQRKS